MKWKKYLRQALEVAADISDIVVSLRENPTYTDYASIALKATNSYLHHSDKLKKRTFKGWDLVDLWEYKDFLFDIAKQEYEVEVLHEFDEGNKDVSITIEGVEFGWEDNHNDVHGPFIKKDVPREKYMNILGRMVWNYLGTTSCEIGKKTGIVDDYGTGSTVFKVDKQEGIHKSNKAIEILNRQKKFIDKGHNRSVMLYGIPGTGKSSAMRYIAKEFGNYSLRIKVSDLDHLSSEDMLLAIELLKPSTIMIDDFDRCVNPTKLLSELEQFNSHVKLLMVSVNHLEMLDDAVVRPGRFDDVIEVDAIDPEIVDKLIGADIPDHIRSKLRRLPIAFVVEFHKRKEVLGLEQALKEIVELERRMKSLRARIASDENAEEFLSTRRRKKKKKKKKKKKDPDLFKGKPIAIEISTDPLDEE